MIEEDGEYEMMLITMLSLDGDRMVVRILITEHRLRLSPRRVDSLNVHCILKRVSTV